MPSHNLHPLCLEHAEKITANTEKIKKNSERIEKLENTINYRKMLFYQVLGTILSGVSTTLLLNILLSR